MGLIQPIMGHTKPMTGLAPKKAVFFGQICGMKDLITDETGDLAVTDGDLPIGDSDLQHQRDIIIAHKGEYKQHPEVGAGIVDLISDENPKAALLTIKRQLEYDGCVVDNIRIDTGGKIIVEATYQ